jgi:hypothetical protein
MNCLVGGLLFGGERAGRESEGSRWRGVGRFISGCHAHTRDTCRSLTAGFSRLERRAMGGLFGCLGRLGKTMRRAAGLDGTRRRR